MAGSSGSNDDAPVELKSLLPEEFLKFAHDLVAFERQVSRPNRGKPKGEDTSKSAKVKVSSLTKLATDGLYDKESYEGGLEKESGKLVKLLPKEN